MKSDNNIQHHCNTTMPHLYEQVLQHSTLAHKTEQVVVAAEKHVQPHLNVILVLVNE